MLDIKIVVAELRPSPLRDASLLMSRADVLDTSLQTGQNRNFPGMNQLRCPIPAIAGRRHVMKAGPAFAVGRFQAPVAALRLFQPCLRIIFVVTLEREFGVGGLGHQKAPLGAFVLLVRLDGDVVDLPLLEILAPPGASAT